MHAALVVVKINQEGPLLSVRNQAEVEKYATETNSYPENPSEPQNRENVNLDPLDPPSCKNISKPIKKNRLVRSIKKL